MAAREAGNAACVADLGQDARQRLTALEASVEAAVLSQRQRFEHLCALLAEVQRQKEAATTELLVGI